MKSASMIKAVKLQQLSLYFLLIGMLSCTTDAVVDGETEGNDDMSGSIEFEDTFILDKERKLTNMILTSADYNKFLEGEGDIAAISKKVYEYFNDDFDFVFILSVEESQPSGLYYGRTTSVQVDVQGIGSSTYNNSKAYGSEERLKTLIHMPRTEYVLSGPFLHELVHYWANIDFVPSSLAGHWGYSNVGGQLGGFDELVDLGNNTYQGKMKGTNGFGAFANGGNSVPYGNLELYLMGLIGVDELNDVLYAKNPEPQGSGKFTADEIITLTPAQLVAEHGSRVPSEADSQKEFKALTVVISKSKLSQEKIDKVSADMENFSRNGEPDDYWGSTYNFWKATFGKASLTIDIENNNIK